VKSSQAGDGLSAAPRLAGAACLLLFLSACGGTDTYSDARGDCARIEPRTDNLHQQVELRTTADGLRWGDITTGSGAQAAIGPHVTLQHLSLQYTGWLQDGSSFDSTRKPGGVPYPLILGVGSVIKGWQEGIPGMRLGGVRRLVIPPTLAYGADGFPGEIPPNATLTYDIQLLCIGN
jgi:FKBP-type peptidyl-prolyl cis-trans isomerase FkpA